ncbi:hypothetical protein KAR91_74570, partial [Candidatus Pacearchaeota archaeon]|nr:hypothetical protein [Candidatus Pacearchaeota archaeon]
DRVGQVVHFTIGGESYVAEAITSTTSSYDVANDSTSTSLTTGLQNTVLQLRTAHIINQIQYDIRKLYKFARGSFVSTSGSGSHAPVTVAGAPLTLSTQEITFNYDGADFQLNGNDLQVKDSGIDHGSIAGLTDLLDHPQYNYSTVGKTGWDKDEYDNITMSFNDGTRTLTLTKDNNFTYWINGVSYTKTANDTVVIDDTEGIWYIYYTGSTLTASQTPWVIQNDDKALVAYLYWDATNNACIFLGYEFHTFHMNAMTHGLFHETIGTMFESGLAVSDNADGTIDVTAGEVHDEDIQIDISDGAGGSLFEQVLSPAQIPIYYRLGAGGEWRKVYNVTSNTYYAYQAAGPTEPYWNEYTGGAWTLNEAANNAYIVYWIVATNDIAEPIISVMGQGAEAVLEQTTINNNDISSFSWGDFPSAEFKIIAQITVRNTGAPYTTTTITDYRQVSVVPSGGYVASDHGSLSGLGDDDHSQYVLADGSRAITAAISIEDITVETPSNIYLLSHDSFADFVEDEHIDWTSTTEAISTTGTITSGTQAITGDWSLNGVCIDIVRDEDDMASDDVNALCTQQSIKKYVDDEVAGAGGASTLEELTDTTITSADHGDFLYYDSSAWVDKTTAEVGAILEADMAHNNLQGLNDGDVYEHLSAAQVAALHAESHAMASHSDDDTYNISTSGTAATGALTVTGAILATSYGGITEANLVDKSASESIAGEWTYGIFPITPSAAPDANYEVANKKYVDDNAGHTHTIYNYATVTSGTGSATFAGGSTDQNILYLSVGTNLIGAKLTTYSFRLNNTHGSLALNYSYYYSDNDLTWDLIGSGSVAASSYEVRSDIFDRYSDARSDSIRYRLVCDHTSWNTSNYTHATVKTGYPLELWS